jgi:hypothetical protein
MQAMTALTTSVYGAPQVFVLQPILIDKDTKLGNVRGGAEIALTLTGERVLLTASGTNEKQQKEEELRHYDEGYEEELIWKEDEGQNNKEQAGREEYYGGYNYVTKNREENRRILGRKEYYENGDYLMGAANEDKEDYHETSYKELTTEGKMVEKSEHFLDEEDREYEVYEKPKEYDSHSEDGSGEREYVENSTEDPYVESEDPTTESEGREGKSTRGNGNVAINESESNKESASNRNSLTDTESKRQIVKLIDSYKDTKDIKHYGSAVTDTADNKYDKLIEQAENDQLQSIHIPEEIVIGYIKESQAEGSKNQVATSADFAQAEKDTTDALGAERANPRLKVTEEVKLAPVVYHVNPKLLPAPTVQAMAM